MGLDGVAARATGRRSRAFVARLPEAPRPQRRRGPSRAGRFYTARPVSSWPDPDGPPPRLGPADAAAFRAGRRGDRARSAAAAVASALRLEVNDTVQAFVAARRSRSAASRTSSTTSRPASRRRSSSSAPTSATSDKAAGRRAVGHDDARPPGPGEGGDGGHVDPARPQGAIPGHGTTRSTRRTRSAARSSRCRPCASCSTSRSTTSSNVNFGGFSRAVNGSAASTSTSTAATSTTTTRRRAAAARYATIDIEPGYQRLCGLDSLDYVRFRHLDDDFVRAARQQSYLEQAKSQVGVGRLFSDRKELLRIFGRYTQTDINSEDGDPAPPRAHLRGDEVADPRGPVPGRDRRPASTYVTITDENLRKTVRSSSSRCRVLTAPARASRRRRPRRQRAQGDARRRRPRRRRSARALAPGLVRGEDAGRGHASRRCRRRRAGCRSTTPRSARPPASPTSPPTRGSTRSETAPATRTRRTGSSATRARTASTGACRARAGARRRSSTTPADTIKMRGRDVPRVLRRHAPAADRLEDARRRLLGVEHAVAHADEPADARHREVAHARRHLANLTALP